MEYYFEGTHDNFIDYLKDKYKKWLKQQYSPSLSAQLLAC